MSIARAKARTAMLELLQHNALNAQEMKDHFFPPNQHGFTAYDLHIAMWDALDDGTLEFTNDRLLVKAQDE